MNRGLIVPYEETPYPIAPLEEADVLEPTGIYPGWSNFASQAGVRAIAYGPRSQRIWVGTWGGVLSWSRLEEKFYRRYSSEHGLVGNAVSCLCLDRDEHPWVGHVEGGLSVFFDRQEKPGEASPGELLAASGSEPGQRGGDWRIYASSTTSLDKIGYPMPGPLRALCRAVTGIGHLQSSGGVWAATQESVFLIPAFDQAPIPIAAGGLGASQAEALLDDGDSLLLGNAWGLFRLRPGEPPKSVAQGQIAACTALAADPHSGFWAGGREAIYYLDGAGQVVAQYATGSRVLALAVAEIDEAPVAETGDLGYRSSQLWALTTAGLGLVDEQGWRLLPTPQDEQGSPKVTPRAIAPSSVASYVWVGADQRLVVGVQHGGTGFASEKGLWDIEQLPPHQEDRLNNLGRCAAPAPFNGEVWLGTAGGPVVFQDQTTWDMPMKGLDVRSLQTSPDGQTLWMLTWPYGITCLGAGQSHEPEMVRLPGLPMLLALGQDGACYAASGGGLYRLKPNGNTSAPQRVFDLPVGLVCLAQVPEAGAVGGVWWAGTTHGILRMTAAGWSAAASGDMGNPAGLVDLDSKWNMTVNAMLVQGETLWAATSQGLWAHKDGQWQRHKLGEQDSTGEITARPSAIFALAASSAGERLWVASEKSLTRYDPQSGACTGWYTPANSGLGSLRVVALLEALNCLWVVTHVGISRLEIKE